MAYSEPRMEDCYECAGSGIVPARRGRVAIACNWCEGTGQVPYVPRPIREATTKFIRKYRATLEELS